MTKCSCILFLCIPLYATPFSLSEFTSYSLWCAVSTISPDAYVVIIDLDLSYKELCCYCCSFVTFLHFGKFTTSHFLALLSVALCDVSVLLHVTEPADIVTETANDTVNSAVAADVSDSVQDYERFVENITNVMFCSCSYVMFRP